MVSLSVSNFTNTTEKRSNVTTESNAGNVALEVSYIFTIIINSITCPFTVLLNVLVIMAVKRRPRLQTNANILLACLAVTDALTGLTSQPSFILLKIFQLHSMTNVATVEIFYNFCARTFLACSCLHLMLVTCERLIAIKFTMYYHNFVTKRNIRASMIACWISSIFVQVLSLANQKQMIEKALLAPFLNSCILFVSFSYLILYRETLRHKQRIKTQQLPREEVERFVRESKAIKTTVYVVGAVVLCLLPGVSFLVVHMSGQVFWKPNLTKPWLQTCGMLNSLLNPLICCWRQQEMRRFIFRLWTTQAVHPAQ